MTAYATPSMTEVARNRDSEAHVTKLAQVEVVSADASKSEDVESSVVPFSTIAIAGRIMLAIVILAAIGAAIVSMIMLGGSLALLGFGVAFAMILFIGMPLILASLGDELESHPH